MRLVADDYAYTSEISKSILWLLENDKIQGTSCMVVTSAWPKDVAALKELSERRPDIQIGLHITLTGDWLKPSSLALNWSAFPTMAQLLLKSHLRLLDADLIEKEIASQIEFFRCDFGRLPDFVDGHEHVHLFPQIRNACVKALHDAGFKGWVRQCGGPLKGVLKRPYRIKSLFLNYLSWSFKRQADRYGIRYNKDFAGIYDFSMKSDFSNLLETWRQTGTEDSVCMCHPGTANSQSDTPDPIAESREREMRILSEAQSR
ncbi:ChbG/HpnK family deacetylase [Pseudovibrio brasiliensis]|uniref:ChbG/HpnK family deacetylase n=1 Tax=Pseudovibrio brasiliensis TaxID=1898042 RepID=A0ABX8AQ46_9HYPH|nr:ChbG/HpnK family deacetylase [Pseudovibrio brasiliensis]QUS57158.1 ChbG/HpnK family deacetylase [Pseudovibrio brasiliensis]